MKNKERRKAASQAARQPGSSPKHNSSVLSFKRTQVHIWDFTSCMAFISAPVLGLRYLRETSFGMILGRNKCVWRCRLKNKGDNSDSNTVCEAQGTVGTMLTPKSPNVWNWLILDLTEHEGRNPEDRILSKSGQNKDKQMGVLSLTLCFGLQPSVVANSKITLW